MNNIFKDLDSIISSPVHIQHIDYISRIIRYRLNQIGILMGTPQGPVTSKTTKWLPPKDLIDDGIWYKTLSHLSPKDSNTKYHSEYTKLVEHIELIIIRVSDHRNNDFDDNRQNKEKEKIIKYDIDGKIDSDLDAELKQKCKNKEHYQIELKKHISKKS